jgi:SHAQKYF class myb-like DNA-binding protein
MIYSRWTPDEHRLFLEGIMLYGKDWKKMQPLIKTRTLVQIRTHAQKVFKKIGLKKIGAGKRRPILPAQKKRKGEDGEVS